MIELYKNIKRLREERGLSQEALAKLTGYSDRSSITKIEKGLVDLQQSKIEIFAAALGTTASDLMGWDDEGQPTTIAAHLDTNDLTQDELDDVATYIEFIKNKRKS